MKRYFVRAETPLKFHNINRFVILPLWIVYTAVSWIKNYDTYFGTISFDWSFAVNLVLDILVITGAVGAFAGFLRWKAYGWYFHLLFLAGNVAYGVLWFIVNAVYRSSLLPSAFATLIGLLLYGVLAFFYYRKRKPLFFGGGAGECPAGEERPAPPRFCWNCGEKLPRESSRFCPYCGTKQSVTKE